MNLDRLAFVDLETTGANPMQDLITEVGIVTVTDGEVSTWNTLVNPGCRIPVFIQRLTGISDAMVADAPTFDALADTIQARLHGYTFIAHNARFDYGFLKNEFKRLGRRFQADVVCTVKLSRKLYPEHYKHNLDSLIERHGLSVGDRHRALADAEAIWQFWCQVNEAHTPENILAALQHQLQRPSLPPHLDAGVLDDLPETPGVYLFHGEGDVLLYVGKGVNLRQRVLAHFNADTREFRELHLGQQTHRIDWIETVGELGALLLESRLIKERQPAHNRKPRRTAELCTWQLVEHDPGDFRPQFVAGDELDLSTGQDCFGLFASKREATLALRKIAEAHRLCLVVLGLETTSAPGRPCIAYPLHQCKGACIGKEPVGLHSARLMSALAKLKLKTWPYPGAIGIVETDEVTGRRDIHVIRGWRYLGTAHDEADLAGILDSARDTAFDRDTYQVLVKHLKGTVNVVPLY
ncbi:MAG: 3'-5' exoribonuclease [Hydrogenophilales bacterium]|nr:3'-5' exoribonuclease [Hydrogenophilales bacterium]